MKLMSKISVVWVFLIVAIIVVPLTSSSYIIGVMCFVAVFGALGIGMGVLMEQAGIFSLAHPTWFGLGAYISGILAVQGVTPPWLGSIVGAVCVAILSVLIGAPLLRLRGYYLACATFGLLLVVEISLAQLGSITGGHEGLMGIPPLTVFGFTFETDIHYYYLSWGLCLACLWFLYNLMGSRVGRAVRAFSDSEIAAGSMGVNVPAFKLKIFVLTAVMASLAGSLYTFYLRFTQPGIFGFPLLVELMTMIIIGGGRTLYGPLLGSFVVLWLRELIHIYLGKLLPRMTAEVDAIFFGVLIIIILVFMPGGLAGWVDRLLGFNRRVIEKATG
ncbi:MAG TPA: branched-chain amino acid ABC transporter permease [Syntrophorhabdus sp.]|jgi:branched-chain amino acid transport system permease protein|nr:branched-chain amino acid ABC transporter permease [Syntrophorhabdus sp.]